jgi:tRNA U38,U39,U40 pseudouridine synthase TruA
VIPYTADERNGLVTQLAALLCQASRLAWLVDSDTFTDQNRERLRELVGHHDYHALTTHLHQMRSDSERYRMHKPAVSGEGITDERG